MWSPNSDSTPQTLSKNERNLSHCIHWLFHTSKEWMNFFFRCLLVGRVTSFLAILFINFRDWDILEHRSDTQFLELRIQRFYLFTWCKDKSLIKRLSLVNHQFKFILLEMGTNLRKNNSDTCFCNSRWIHQVGRLSWKLNS